MEFRYIKTTILSLTCAVSIVCCRNIQSNQSKEIDGIKDLKEQLYDYVNLSPGTVGIAIVSDNDTITINNGVHYGMMSVFKLHEALAVCGTLERKETSVDSILTISQNELDEDTWSPMLKEYGKRDLSLPIRDLIKYAVSSSDNNASNILYARVVSPRETDQFVKSIAADTTFSIKHTEADMELDHALYYENFTSPLSAALLIRQVFTSPLITPQNQELIKDALLASTTGQDRIGAIMSADSDIIFGHKTGSGARNKSGELTVFNDVAYIKLPNGVDYSLAVLLRDFYGSDEDAVKVMADISSMVYSYFRNRQ